MASFCKERYLGNVTKRLIAVCFVLGFACSEEEPKPVIECSTDLDCELGKLCYESLCQHQERYKCLEGGEEVPKMDFSPTTLAFGETGSSTKALTVSIKNSGQCALSIVDASIDAIDPNRFSCDICSANLLPILIYPERINTFEVFMHPGLPGDYDGGLVLKSNDPETSAVRIPITGKSNGKPILTVLPEEIDFGFMRAGGRVEKQVFIINEGSGTTPLTVEKAELVQDSAMPFSLNSGIILPATIAPARIDAHAGIVITVAYHPNLAADHQGELLIYHDGGQMRRVSLKGSELPPNIYTTPLALDFETVQLGRVAYQRLTVQNYVGGVNPLLAQARFASSTTQDLRILRQLPKQIPPGGVAELDIIFEPTIAGQIQNNLLIESNDPDEPTLTIPIIGNGEAIGEEVISVEMSFVADSSSLLDIDLRDVDLILENPAGQVCREAMPQTRWGTKGDCTWSATPPKENPERFVLSQVTEDGVYKVKLNYIEDCATLPTALAASLLGLGTEALVEELSEGEVRVTREEIANVVEEVCAERRHTTASVTVLNNGQIVAEQNFRVESKGALIDAFTLTRSNGRFSVSP